MAQRLDQEEKCRVRQNLKKMRENGFFHTLREFTSSKTEEWMAFLKFSGNENNDENEVGEE